MESHTVTNLLLLLLLTYSNQQFAF